MRKLDIDKIEINHVIQPIVNIRNNIVIGYEFLLRTNRFRNPELLFGFAKEQDQLFELDMKSIWRVLNIIEEKSKEFEEQFLFINVFPTTLIEPSFYDTFLDYIMVKKIKPESLVLEINESDKEVDLSELKKVANKLKKEGFNISLDDVGKGESTIKLLLEIEPDIAKIDQYFSQGISRSIPKQKIIKYLLDFFGEQTKMILEGLEYEEDYLTAKHLGVSIGQGYFIGKPVSIESYTNAWYGTRRS